MNRMFMLGIAFLCVCFGGVHAGEQLLNLGRQPKGGHFEVKPRQWPAEHGRMNVCLWARDKVACVTIGVDDNCAPEHGWWIEIGRNPTSAAPGSSSSGP